MTAAEEDQATAPGAGEQAPAPVESAPVPPPGPPVGWLAPIESTTAAPRGPSALSSTASRWAERTTDAARRAGHRLATQTEASSQRVAPVARRLTERLAPLTRRAARIDLLALALNVALIASGGLLIAAAARVELEIGLLDAPLWLFAAAALLTGATLGAIRGFLAVGLYLGLGLLGAALGPDGVAAHLDGPWAGVLLALPVAAALTGVICSTHSSLRSPVTSQWYFFGWFFFGALTGMATLYAAGLGLLTRRLDVDGWDLFATMSARFPFDVAQCVLVAILATIIHRFAPALLRRERRRDAAGRLDGQVGADRPANA